LIEQIAPGFYKASGDYFESGIGFSFIWLITFAIIASRQKKTVEKEQIEREQEAEKRRLVEFQNAELERLVAARTAEITSQKEELEHAIAELRMTQTQLIQSEKMASLGELTAGIAHEIQNPLNFVNNFSEVSVELVEELADEQQKPNRDADLEADLLADLKQNLQKITQHGSRASSIVRGMLQHSRASTGQREPTDLNALCDEYLRLAYHGLRAKDKTFNAHFTTDLDANLGLVTVVAQDLGRVLLNLFTNAFYAVHQKQKQTGALTGPGYQPTVQVQTCCKDGQAVVRVIDNGIGIPDSVRQKIFQPFFTTKPTGEGTGLGLSLAYDIVTKGHLGTLDVQSREGEGTEFIIRLPA
jgi:signal transduction histidine kinase